MAKFSRFDPRNKKSGQHKRRTKDGFQFKKIRNLEVKKGKVDYEKETIRAQGD
jgi:hypothetical protein